MTTQIERQSENLTTWPNKARQLIGLRKSERTLLLGVVDFLLLSSALIIAVVLRTELLPDSSAIISYAKWFVTLFVIWLSLANVFDLYNLARAASTNAIARASTLCVATTAIIYTATPWLTPPIENRIQTFLFIGLATIFVTVWRLVYAHFIIQPAFQRRALVVGAGSSGQQLAQILAGTTADQAPNPFRGSGYQLVGFIDDDDAKQHTLISEISVLGSGNQLVEFARRLQVDDVIIAISNTTQINPDLVEAILDCRELGIPITNMTTIYERLTSRVAIEHASQDIEAATGHQDSAFVRLFQFVKRVFDILGAALGGMVLLVLILPVWLVNRLASPGPLFYKQQRVGHGGKPFSVIKFRSMVPNAESTSGAVWAEEDDPRITRVGRWLRLTHLDELPQVINVLRGEMSLVGPRPERPEFVGDLSRQIPFYRARHCVKPGLTGWAQIHHPYGASVEDARTKLEYDLYYIKNASPLLDISIVLRTISKIFGFSGR